MDLASAYETVVEEVDELLPDGAVVVDAHTHLGADEDGQSLDPGQLLGFLDQLGPSTRACTFPFHDPERAPAYRLPNDRVLQWARESDGRLYPYCRLDPEDDPVREAERCLALGARGIKLHPRAQAFDFAHRAEHDPEERGQPDHVVGDDPRRDAVPAIGELHGRSRRQARPCAPRRRP